MSMTVHGAARRLLIVLGTLLLLPPLPALAQATKGGSAKLSLEQRLEKKLEEQDARIRELERRLEAQQHDAAQASAAPAVASAAQEQQQEQQIKVLERKLEIQQEEAKTAAASAPVVKATPTRLLYRIE